MTADIPVQAEAAFQRAFALHRLGQLGEALALYQHRWQLEPQHARAGHLMGITALQSNEAEAALQMIGREAFASRVAASVLRAVGLPELITETQEQYEELAIALGRDPERLARIRQRLAGHRQTAPLFDSRRFTQNLEAAYQRIYERYQADLPPEDLPARGAS